MIILVLKQNFDYSRSIQIKSKMLMHLMSVKGDVGYKGIKKQSEKYTSMKPFTHFYTSLFRPRFQKLKLIMMTKYRLETKSFGICIIFYESDSGLVGSICL